MISREQREQARVDPSAVFDSPEEIVSANDLSREEKIDFLRRWRYDAIELDVAADEGMGRGSNALLDRITAALDELDPDGRHEPGRHS